LRRRERGRARLAEVDRLERLQAWAVERKPGSPKEYRYVEFDGHKGPGKKVDPDKPYVVGNKKPPLHTRFKPGQSGNPNGRPKRQSKDLDLVNFGELFRRELYKTVVANVNGKVVKKSQAEVLVAQMVKQAIHKGGTHTRIALQFLEAHEARMAAKEALKAKQMSEGAVEIDWDEERERVYQDLMTRANAALQAAKEDANG
jgi:hypothetical protein